MNLLKEDQNEITRHKHCNLESLVSLFGSFGLRSSAAKLNSMLNL